MNKHLLSVARLAHRSPLLRACARKLAAGRTVTQTFHSGVICLDAVEHSWAWTGSRRLEDFERPVQDRLCELASTRRQFIDIGCSIGVMTLSVLLRVPHITTVSIDAAPRAIELLRHSLGRNRLEPRAQLEDRAISSGATELTFAKAGCFTGHVTTQGTAVPATPLPALLQHHLRAPAVIKIDIEGYEAVLADALHRLPALPGSVLVLEAHPLGFNGLGDPAKVIRALHSRGDVIVRSLGGAQLSSIDPAQFHQIEAHWNA